MLTVKFMKYERPFVDGRPSATKEVAVHEARSVHLRYESGMQFLQLGNAPADTLELSIGQDREDTSYDVAYIMNSAGKTIETVR